MKGGSVKGERRRGGLCVLAGRVAPICDAVASTDEGDEAALGDVGSGAA